MKKEVLPNIEKSKLLFVETTDNEMFPGPVPQLIKYRRIKGVWQRTILVGYHSIQEVRNFLR